MGRTIVAGIAPGGSSGGFGCSDGLGSFGRLDLCDGFAAFVAFGGLVACGGLVVFGGLAAFVGPDPFDGSDFRLPGFMGAFRWCWVMAGATDSRCRVPD
jgi:hypothetical protein